LGKDAGDPYAQKLLELVRKAQPERRLDKLLISGLIEARSCERLALLADGLTDPPLARFYKDLATSEDGHQELFFRLAAKADGEATALRRLDELLDAEADILSSLPLEPRIH
jgi:tRNA-(ms[2]io[6]A)-hydroxylase